jgi:hypothetical protein
VKIPLNYVSDAVETAAEDGYFQGAGVLLTVTGSTYIVASISGRLFQYDASGAFAVTELTGGDVNSPTLAQAWFVQAEDTLVIQDDQSKPFLYDGATLVRAGDNQVPVGGPMAYGNGRLWVAHGSAYVGGDLAYSNPAYGRKTVLYFTENTFLNEGGAFAVPAQLGTITALAFVAQQDTANAVGGLMVFTNSSIQEFDAPVDRTIWKDLQQPLQRFALIEFGSFSPIVTPVNGDLFFRARDGVRSFYFARREFGGWGNTGIGNEVERVQAKDDELLLNRCSSVNFDNRMLMTCQPQLSPSGVFHRALMSLDFDIVSGMRDKQPPCWEGVWTGLKILQILTAVVLGKRRCFAFVIGADNKIELWELSKDERFDNGDVRIACAIELRSMNAKAPFVPKRLESADMSLDHIVGNVMMTVRFRPDLYPSWVMWHNWGECAEYQLCDDDVCATTLPDFQEENVARRGIGQPADCQDCQKCIVVRDGYEFQVRVEWTGHLRIKRFRIGMTVLPETTFGKIQECCPT